MSPWLWPGVGDLERHCFALICSTPLWVLRWDGLEVTLLFSVITRTLHFTPPSLWLHCRDRDVRVLGYLEPSEGTQKDP